MTSMATHQVYYLMGIPTAAAAGAVGSGTTSGGGGGEQLDMGFPVDLRSPSEGSEDYIDSLIDSFKVPEDGYVDKFLAR